MQTKKRPASGAPQRCPAKKGDHAFQKRTPDSSPHQTAGFTDSQLAATGLHRGETRSDRLHAGPCQRTGISSISGDAPPVPRFASRHT